MKFLFTLLAFVATVMAQSAIVQNNCTYPVYVQSVPYDNSQPGPLTTVRANTTFSEFYRASGSSIKMGTQPALAAPLLFGYSRTDNPSLVYYELNNRFGNPFQNTRVRQFTSRQPCPSSNCAAGQTTCYSGPGRQKVYSCARPTNVQVTLCASM